MKKEKKKVAPALPFLEEKGAYFARHSSIRSRKKWYKEHYPKRFMKVRFNSIAKCLRKPKKLPKMMNFARWVLVDFFEIKPRKFWGVYQFVAMPGEGKTLSMVAHMEREIRHWGREGIYIATNFYYQNEDMEIHHWLDIIEAARYARSRNMLCIIAIDEIHVGIGSDARSFPPALKALLSFNRKYHLQFLCSSQVYEDIPTAVKRVGNYVVICENTLGLDRHFVNRYYTKRKYDTKFSGKRKDCDMIFTYVADDALYALYDTRRQVERMSEDASTEKDKRSQAFDILFGGGDAEEGTE